jgi:hypothetical protein
MARVRRRIPPTEIVARCCMNAEMILLARRVDRLERENRRWRMLGVVGLTVLAVLSLTGLTVKDPMVGAQAFTLVNSEGQIRAVFAMVENEPTLAFFDNGRKVRAGLSLVGNAPKLILYGEDGNPIWQAPPVGGSSVPAR